MVQRLPNPPPGFETLSFDERLRYVQTLWELVISAPETVPLPEWQARELQERLDKHRADPGAARPWSEVRGELREKFSSSSG